MSQLRRPALVLLAITLSSCAGLQAKFPMAESFPPQVNPGGRLTLGVEFTPDFAEPYEITEKGIGVESNDLGWGPLGNIGIAAGLPYGFEVGYRGFSAGAEDTNDDEKVEARDELKGWSVHIRKEAWSSGIVAASGGMRYSRFTSSYDETGIPSASEEARGYLVDLPLLIGVRGTRESARLKHLVVAGLHAYTGIKPFVGSLQLWGNQRSVRRTGGILGVGVPVLGLGGQLAIFMFNLEMVPIYVSSPVRDSTLDYAATWHLTIEFAPPSDDKDSPRRREEKGSRRK